MIENENTYGFEKRLAFFVNVIEKQKPRRILDFGCGTGANVTVPLAKQFPKIKIVGVDGDKSTIEYARANSNIDNLYFAYPQELDEDGKFDLIIASEVVEHVEHPGEFLSFLREKVEGGGKIILTLPNGYGPSELARLFEAVMTLLGVLKLLRRLKRLFSGSSAVPADRQDTLATSPHINFFSYKEINKCFSDAGLNVVRYRPRTFLCGYGFDHLLRNQRLLSWNAKIAEWLPPRLNSGWMFVLEKTGPTKIGMYKRGLYARWRKYLNMRRWGLR